MPGVIMCEAAAQLSSYFSQKTSITRSGNDWFSVAWKDVRFREPVRPGDRLVVAVETRPREAKRQ